MFLGFSGAEIRINANEGVVLRQETIPPSVDRLLKYSDARSWRNQRTLTVDKGILLNCLRKIVEREPLDEQRYLKTYPDVRNAFQKKKDQLGLTELNAAITTAIEAVTGDKAPWMQNPPQPGTCLL